MKIIERCGFSGFDGENWVSYFVLGVFWFHVNRRFHYPFISFRNLPF